MAVDVADARYQAAVVAVQKELRRVYGENPPYTIGEDGFQRYSRESNLPPALQYPRHVNLTKLRKMRSLLLAQPTHPSNLKPQPKPKPLVTWEQLTLL